MGERRLGQVECLALDLVSSKEEGWGTATSFWNFTHDHHSLWRNDNKKQGASNEVPYLQEP